MRTLLIAICLFSGNVFSDSTIDLINDLTSEQPKKQQVDDSEVKTIRQNAYGNGCGPKPFMNLPVGCYLSCQNDEWVKVCN